MKHFDKKTNKGIMQTLVIIVVAIILIAYFRNNIQGLFHSAKVKEALLTAIAWIQQALLWVVDKLGWTSDKIK